MLRKNGIAALSVLMFCALGVFAQGAKAPTLIGPSGLFGAVKEIDELTPLFSWNPGEKDGAPVPYYHIMLSAEPFPISDLVNGTSVGSLNLNIIWQAITPNTSIRYGAPDPSNTITATPPPLSPGTDYTWLVLNNFGNHMAFTDGSAFDIPGAFRIKGEKLNEPRVTSPANNAKINNNAESIRFEWTNLDTRANSYLVNLFVYTDPEVLGVGSLNDLPADNVSATMLVWETTVSRGQSQTLSATLNNPAGTLSGGTYMWRVYALDSRGAGTTGNSSRRVFSYDGVSNGKVEIRTRDVSGGAVSFANLKSEVISGPMQAPLAFITGADGSAARDFPAGTYSVTASKDGYNNAAVTFTVTGGQTTPVNIYMAKPAASMSGRAADIEDSSWINQAKVTAVSEWGDTVTALTNAGGNFTVSGREGDWTITVEKAGYRTPRPVTRSVRTDDKINIGTIYMERNPFALSGTVSNADGLPVIGARVRVLSGDGVLIDELASTPQTGRFSFSLQPGTYTLTAEKAGFSMFSRSGIALTGSLRQDAVIRGNAAVINGTLIGKSWSGSGYLYAAIPNARITFTNVNDAADSLTVAADATFGKFSISVDGEKRYRIRSEAGGFVNIAGRGLPSVTTQANNTVTINDTLQALARISGTAMSGSAPAGDVDVIVYNAAAGSIAASSKSSQNGLFEVRGIPDGDYSVNAGKAGYYLDGEPRGLKVESGRPTPGEFSLAMRAGDKSIAWNVGGGFSGSGSIKVISPLNKIIPFNTAAGAAPKIDGVGPGEYIMEAAAESDQSLLQLSYRKFTIAGSARDVTQNIDFPLSHASNNSITLADGRYTFTVVQKFDVNIDSLKLFYRSEGSVRYDSAVVRDGKMDVSFAPARDGCDLQYYFRVYVGRGDGTYDIYGSEKQIFRSYVNPSRSDISRIGVSPGPSSDTLFLPSSYEAAFTFNAFYSSLYLPIDSLAAAAMGANVSWAIEGASGGARLSSGSGRRVTLATGSGGAFVLTVRLAAGSDYSITGADNISIPVRVTGKPLARLAVDWNEDAAADAITSSQRANFSVRAFDSSGRAVAVSPAWSITPANAGEISSGGTFTPWSKFFGTVRVHAEADGKKAEYAGESDRPGLRVAYVLRNKADTAHYKGLRLGFKEGSVTAGESAEFQAGVSEVKNNVFKGGGDYMLADTAYELTVTRLNRLSAANDIVIMLDIPEHLKRDAAKKTDGFKIARWYPDSLKWVVLPSSEVSGGVARARLNAGAKDADNDKAAAAKSKANKKLSKKGGASKESAAAPASEVHAFARYALVSKTEGLSVNVSVSPNPFSPYIRPVRTHGSDAPGGTCIKVRIETSDYVPSLKAHIYNAAGTRVWAVEVQNANVGENNIWWDGRTTGREEMWNENFLEQNKNKGKMCRNGRYFVTVIVKDVKNREKRVMKPIVLMK